VQPTAFAANGYTATGNSQLSGIHIEELYLFEPVGEIGSSRPESFTWSLCRDKKPSSVCV